MIDKLNEDGILALLKRGLIGRIGCHAEGMTYIVPVSYAYEDEFIYVHAYEGMKIKLMRQNPAVCFEVDDITDTSNWQSVIAWGSFEELQGVEMRTKALQILNNRVLPLQSSATTHLGNAWPFVGDPLNEVDGIFFRIKIAEKTGRYEYSGLTPHFNY